jgi:hypothetical protein
MEWNGVRISWLELCTLKRERGRKRKEEAWYVMLCYAIALIYWLSRQGREDGKAGQGSMTRQIKSRHNKAKYGKAW